MKITAVKGIKLRCACPQISDALSTSTARQAYLIRIDTDTGISGIGEAFTYGAPMDAMEAVLRCQIEPILAGQDPMQIERLWHTMYWRTIANGRRSMTMGVISGVDIALWDLLGKAAHMPVSRLLGAYADCVPSYASGGFYAPGKSVDDLCAEIEGYMDQGYRDVKIKIGRVMDRPGAPLGYMAVQDAEVTQEEDYRRIERVKSIIGSGLLAVDTNASWDMSMAVGRAQELVRLGVEWLEEPIPFEDIDGYRTLAESLPQLQIVGCETQQGAANFNNMLRAGAIDIVQPDLGWAGGFSEVRKIGDMAGSASRKISLHCFGSAVLFAASLHMAAAMENSERIESEENENPLKSELLKAPVEADGQMNFYVPQGDGLGIEIDWDRIEKYAVRS